MHIISSLGPSVGHDHGSPVSDRYHDEFRFQGTLEQVDITLVSARTAEADAAGYPLFALGRFMRTGKDRVQVDAVGAPVTLAGVRVAPGDIVVADQDGVVIVPAGRAHAVFERALAMQAVELRIVAAALDGMSLRDARRQFGYHTLQRKPAAA